MSRRAVRVVALAVVALLGVGIACDVAGARARVGTAPAARRVVQAAVVAAHVAATPAVAPVRLVARGDTIVVLDAAHRRLFRWDVTVRPWSAPLSRAPHQVTAAAASLGVLDARDARLTRLDPAGRVVGRVPLAHVATPLAACPFGDGGWLVLTAHPESALVRVEPSGRVTWQRPLPWAAPARWPASHRQGVLAAWRGACVVALAFGPGWAVVEADGHLPTVMPLRDAPATIRAPRAPLMADLAVRADTAELLVAGETADAFRVVDRYHLRTGAYLGSVRLPGPVRALSAIPGGWGVIVPTPAGPYLARLTLAPPSVGNRAGIR